MMGRPVRKKGGRVAGRPTRQQAGAATPYVKVTTLWV